MKSVRAIKLGFLPGPTIHRVREGQVVQVPDNFVADWFVELDDPKAAKKEEEPRPTTLSQVAKARVRGPVDLA